MVSGEDEKAQLLKTDAASKPSPYDRSIVFKVAILLGISMISFGSYFSYDSVSALEAFITESLSLSTFEFGLLFSVYSFPNIVLVIVGGWLIDRLGNRTSAVLFCVLIAVGTGLVAVAAMAKSFVLMLVGRLIFGLGSESSYVVQNSMCVEWFRDKHLAIAMGATISVSRLGSVFAFNAEAAIAERTSYVFALWAAFDVCVVSLVFCIVYFVMDLWAKRFIGDESGDEADRWKMPSWSVIRQAFNLQYWLWVAIAVTIYSTIFPFRALASAEIAAKWDIDEAAVGSMMSTIDIASLIMSPICGLLVDYTGKRGYLVVAGNTLGVIAYLVLGLTSVHPMVGLVILGLHFSLMPAALWPCVPLLAHPKHEAVAFAIVSALINASLTGVIPLGGLIIDEYDFKALCVFFADISVVSVVLALLWNFLDACGPRPVLNVKDTPKVEAAETVAL
eukprot:TRINITY_DN32010_c0_g1_i1.p1 TRINITY_DN32010_c0_g1~~TRINITY_DN32010_c0_g1_i1.p1  ORF type:complete len:448 (+),score=91.94 TRINITY_DN32010_c0_g1_i1:128-1471(+)